MDEQIEQLDGPFDYASYKAGYADGVDSGFQEAGDIGERFSRRLRAQLSWNAMTATLALFVVEAAYNTVIGELDQKTGG